VTSSKSLWFIVEHDHDNPVSFFVEGPVLISPYLYTKERDALAAVEDDHWPEDVADKIVAKPGPHHLFLDALKAGFPNTQPKSPDVFSLNGDPGSMLSGLVPLTAEGAAFVDRVGNTNFWGEIAQYPGALHLHAVETMNIALGISGPN
tara:strand:+ start:3987 stop:4430 length:444 start_codon:yes stop_codon:yes gene_type:complete